jgi:hypothetical protein
VAAEADVAERTLVRSDRLPTGLAGLLRDASPDREARYTRFEAENSPHFGACSALQAGRGASPLVLLRRPSRAANMGGVLGAHGKGLARRESQDLANARYGGARAVTAWGGRGRPPRPRRRDVSPFRRSTRC